MALPANISTGRVTGQFIVGVVDGADGDDEPDFIAAQGTIAFTASTPYLPNPTASPNPVTMLKTTILGVLDGEGYLCTPLPGSPSTAGARGIRLVATDDPDASVEGWTWKATPRFRDVNGTVLHDAIQTFDFALPSGSTVDLTTVVKVPASNGTGIEQAQALAAAAHAAAVSAAASAAAVEDKALANDAGVAAFMSAGTQTSAALASVIDARIAPHEEALAGKADLVQGKVPTAQVDLTAVTPANGGRPVGRGELLINVQDYGVVGDGVTDDTAAFKAAVSAAGSTGLPLFIPKTFNIGVSSFTTTPPNINIQTNGATFTGLRNMGRAPVLNVQSNTTITGGVNIRVISGPNCQGFSIGAGSSNVVIDSIDVRADKPGAGNASLRDNGFRTSENSDIRIGSVKVVNFDYAIFAETVSHLKIGHIEVESYMCGAHFTSVSHLEIGSGWVHTASPNATYSAGHNGLLLGSGVAGCRNIHVNNFLVENSTEHGFRVSGPEPITDIYFTDCTARNVGGTGFKVLGATLAQGFYNENIVLTNFIGEDCGQINQNTVGIMIQMANHVQINNPIIRKRNQEYAAVEGIRLSGVKYVTITNPEITDVLRYGLRIEESMGDVAAVKVTGMSIESATAHSVYLQNGGVDFSNIEIEGTVRGAANSGAAFYAGRATVPANGTFSGVNIVKLRATGHGSIVNSAAPSESVAAIYGYIMAPKSAADKPFKNGSEWTDSATGVKSIVKNGVWTAM